MENLPKIQELYEDTGLKIAQNDLNILLNQPPKESWLKKHPIAKNVKYIPIERIEWLMTKIFFRWHLEIKQVQIIANSVSVTVRLHYQNPLSNEMLWQDGIGAMAIQTDKGKGAMDWNYTKPDGVMKAAPAAESYAFKDAAEKIGKLFGKDMNRADQIAYDSLASTFEMKEDKHAEIFNEESDQNFNK